MKSSLDNFQNLNILFIGDIILVTFLYGESNRISPEAPIPVYMYSDFLYLTPNLKEATEATKTKIKTEGDIIK